ncbi:protein FRA10AC1 homolog [Rhynchophorus ferrugineus]|uniref:Protein FRA10AC1-like protein n=1 Tax=Rhynchophorus ferrugineus TaxID=354439 RepID=A0A834IQW1_RHYFE|nr:hypothetical protein GWI33_022299 [Rhynchophorus ferrugineus]
MNLRSQMRYLNCYELHKLIVNEYILRKSEDIKSLKRDTSKDRNDYHVIKENHKFLWRHHEIPGSWEEQFAKKYYEKLFKEYAIADLSFFKDNKIALRWRTEQEVVVGRGQFTCGNKHCKEKDSLRTWEVNFAYEEHNEKKNALVKLRLCPPCSTKLNYHSKKREVKRIKKTAKRDIPKNKNNVKPIVNVNLDPAKEINASSSNCDNPENTDKWEHQKIENEKSREDEMEEYLQDLLL